jgi:hypothetical protein
MVGWVKRTIVPVPANGTTSAIAAFPQATSGNVLLAFAASAATISTPSGWTLVNSSVSTSGAYLWSRTSNGSESSLPITLSVANQAVVVVVYELPPQTAVIASHGEQLPRSGVAAVGLSGMLDTPKQLLHFGAFQSETSAVPAPGVTWDGPEVTDVWAGQAAPSGAAGMRVLAGYLEDSALASWQPRNLLTDSAGFAGTTDRISVALVTPGALAAPQITFVETTSPATPGGSDGTVLLEWTPVAGAARYAVGYTPGDGPSSSFVIASSAAVSPYTITGLTAGRWTCGVRAYPAP